MFVAHTPDSAPEASRRILESTTAKFGYLPAPMAKLAESPELLSGFLANTATFDRTTLTPLERETVVMTIATHVGCHYCVAMHTATLTRQSAPDDLIESLRAEKSLPDERLETLRRFTLAVMAGRGEVEPDILDTFLAAGFTRRNALEVVLGIGTYTISTYANRLVDAELDAPLEPYRW
ncbi:carboxymuconolactone decarboxylase family protein [Actinokineospora enzanensis]|uniref:carboxymuconolactone decarboxylase family protein n=1 Tax=Actinokineospora enzanensis TaxID=155975 RepID=UPI00037FAEF9|nr:carboxymuconolactone decarboxylase family protein [Actinokineospora enzanensis]